ncbi:hypothetical protein EVAR_29005_1 [Eumeta japonica]|uniref:Uncharacterized protein n=1 Tax=Eumeta variegata TaxID=151549 RepID=A0A4C1W5A6_EUMVA|nr:hypothetical protein EVAR_29005_1 [Eumeta japonica]
MNRSGLVIGFYKISTGPRCGQLGSTKGAGATREYHTLTEYRRELTGSISAFRLVNESYGSTLPSITPEPSPLSSFLPPSDIPLLNYIPIQEVGKAPRNRKEKEAVERQRRPHSVSPRVHPSLFISNTYALSILSIFRMWRTLEIHEASEQVLEFKAEPEATLTVDAEWALRPRSVLEIRINMNYPGARVAHAIR